MPNLGTHLNIALEAARRLDHSTVHSHIGSFLLGCTAPDIRILTKERREETHFSLLTTDGIGEGVRLMFERYPRLAVASNLSEATQAFMVGYVSHLLADAAWIILVYRPYFGNQEIFPDRREGDFMDRALQLEMDRKVSEEFGGMEWVRDYMGCAATSAIEVDFIHSGTLVQWCQRLSRVGQLEFSWERLRSVVRKHLSVNASDCMGMVDEFMCDVSSGVELIYRRVPVDAIQRFREQTIQEFLCIARRYMP